MMKYLFALLLVALLGLCSQAFLPLVGPSKSRNRGEILALNLFNKKPAAPAKKTFTLTVKQRFYKDAEIEVDGGAPVNLRKELLKNKIDLYPLQGKLSNCGGGGVCGTCAVQIIDGAKNLNPKGPVEYKALPNKGDDIRLACCTRATGDVVLKTKP